MKKNKKTLLIVIASFALLAALYVGFIFLRNYSQLQQVRAEIEAACGIPFTGMINNANLGAETDADVVLRSLAHARACSRELGLPLRGNALPEQLMPSLAGQVPDAIALQLQKRPIDL